MPPLPWESSMPLPLPWESSSWKSDWARSPPMVQQQRLKARRKLLKVALGSWRRSSINTFRQQ
eukprot:6726807-Alexandrium_andersonii.AAC.1